MNKTKGVGAILFLAISVHMMVTTKYAYALGDYLLLWLGLKPWSGGFKGTYFLGTHYTVFYFGVLSILALILVKKYAIKKANIRSRNIFIIFIALLYGLNLLTNVTVKMVKANSEGLKVMSIDNTDNFMEYEFKGGEYVEIRAEIELTNCSDNLVEFRMKLINPQYYHDKVLEEFISIEDKNGEPVIFRYKPKEKRKLVLTVDKYKFVRNSDEGNGNGRGPIDEIILIDKYNREIRLKTRDFIDING